LLNDLFLCGIKCKYNKKYSKLFFSYGRVKAYWFVLQCAIKIYHQIPSVTKHAIQSGCSGSERGFRQKLSYETTGTFFNAPQQSVWLSLLLFFTHTATGCWCLSEKGMRNKFQPWKNIFSLALANLWLFIIINYSVVHATRN
jgi:hypothetical protein